MTRVGSALISTAFDLPQRLFDSVLMDARTSRCEPRWGVVPIAVLRRSFKPCRAQRHAFGARFMYHPQHVHSPLLAAVALLEGCSAPSRAILSVRLAVVSLATPQQHLRHLCSRPCQLVMLFGELFVCLCVCVFCLVWRASSLRATVTRHVPSVMPALEKLNSALSGRFKNTTSCHNRGGGSSHTASGVRGPTLCLRAPRQRPHRFSIAQTVASADGVTVGVACAAVVQDQVCCRHVPS